MSLQERFAAVLRRRDDKVYEETAEELAAVQGATCQCRGGKCGPHRYWPSLVGWVVAGMLVVTLIMLLSVLVKANVTRQEFMALATRLEDHATSDRKTMNNLLDEVN